jgi:CubicO group peptidase (beta-lactamase class C family)
MTFRAFMNPPMSIPMFNLREMHAAEVPAANGITTARSLSRLYAACIGEVDGVRLLDSQTVEAARALQSGGPDLVLVPDDVAIASGFFLPDRVTPMAGPGSFGHGGLGGSLGFAHPELGVAFGYVMNQCQSHPDGNPRTQALCTALLSCVA